MQNIDEWQFDRVFVINVVDTTNGLKILGINAINSSGFYACDIGKFVTVQNTRGYTR